MVKVHGERVALVVGTWLVGTFACSAPGYSPEVHTPRPEVFALRWELRPNQTIRLRLSVETTAADHTNSTLVADVVATVEESNHQRVVIRERIDPVMADGYWGSLTPISFQNLYVESTFGPDGMLANRTIYGRGDSFAKAVLLELTPTLGTGLLCSSARSLHQGSHR